MLPKQVSRVWNTVRHLKKKQIAGRLFYGIRQQVGYFKLPEPPVWLTPQSQNHATYPVHNPWNTPKQLKKRVFRFLNQSQHLGLPINWQSDMPLLWQFNLHYFDYLPLLDAKEQHAFCRDWIAQNPVGTQPGWYAYPTSLRVINWCKADLQAQDVLASLYRQAAYVYRNPETHILGNHLLENARALIFAGCFFSGQGEADGWLKRGLAIYREQTPEQILADGGHFERSPMYHAIVLEGYVDVLNLLPNPHPDREWLQETVARMSDFLESMTYPNDTFPLFNDSTHEIALDPQVLLDYVHTVAGYSPTPRVKFPDTGYYVYHDETCYLAIDGGPVAPDYLPAHAHADIFSYVLSIHGIPFITDTGVYEYQSGAMRDYVRSTGAHNTVCIDKTDQVECWDSFRVARRKPPRDVMCKRDTGTFVFEGTFDGYEDLIGDGLVHHRRIYLDLPGRRLQVKDTVRGKGVHTVASRVHLHPSVQVEPLEGGWKLMRDGVVAEILTNRTGVELEKGWYCPEFGKRIKRTVLLLRADAKLPMCLSYTISW